MNYCYECTNQLKGYCKKAIELHDEPIQISGHTACEHFKTNKEKVTVIVPNNAISLISGAKLIYRQKNGTVTVVYTDNESHTRYLKETKEEIDNLGFLKVVRKVQEMELTGV